MLQETYKLKWNMKSIKYLGIILKKGVNTLYNANYTTICQELEETWKKMVNYLSRF